MYILKLFPLVKIPDNVHEVQCNNATNLSVLGSATCVPAHVGLSAGLQEGGRAQGTCTKNH